MKRLSIVLTIASFVFATSAMAITTSEILQKYGKYTVREFILKKSPGTITAQVDDVFLIKYGRISTDYITAASVNNDFTRLGWSPGQAQKMINQYCKQIEQEKAKKQAEDKIRNNEIYHKASPQKFKNASERERHWSYVKKAAAPTRTGRLTGPQKNAVKSAKNYIRFKGFSRRGLIKQLSSDYGDGYNVADATVAVDSLNIDWNRQAVRSAKNYLSFKGFSCKGLIRQLSSSAGSGFTKSQATYGARHAGACQ